jgi:TolA-binding protein
LDLKEEWSNLPGRTKMFIIGAGILALFFLYTGVKNRNKQQSQTQTQTQDTSVGPQQAAIDPTSWIDAQTQQTQQMQQMIGGMQDNLSQYQQSNQQAQQQNMQALQQLVQQNQQAVQQQIQSLHDSMSTPPVYSPVPSMPNSSDPPKSIDMYRLKDGNGNHIDSSVGTTLYQYAKAGYQVTDLARNAAITKGKTRYINSQGQHVDTDVQATAQDLIKKGYIKLVTG